MECPRDNCPGIMKKGVVIGDNDADERGCFRSTYYSKPTLVECWKCDVCGHTISLDDRRYKE